MAVESQSKIPARALIIFVGILAGLLPAFVKPLIVLGAGLGVVVTVAILRNPRVGIILIALSIPLETAGRLGTLTANLPLTLPKILTAVTLAAWLANVFLRKMTYRRLSWMYLLPIFLAAACLSLVGAQELRSGLEAVFRFATTVVFFFLVVQLVDSPRMLKLTLIALILTSTAAAGYALLQRYMPGAKFAFRLGWEETAARRSGVERDIVEQHMVGVVERSSGLSVHSILLSLNIALLAAPLAALIANVRRRDFLLRLFWLAVTAILLAALVSTYARTGFLLLVFALVLMLLRGLFKLTRPMLIAALVCMVIVLAVLPEKYYRRVLDIESYSTKSRSISTRLEAVSAAGKQFLDHPVLGVGYGNRYGIFDYYHQYPDKEHAVTPHNAYMQIASQVGLVGLILLMFFFWKVHRHTMRSVKVFRDLGKPELARLGSALDVSMLVFLFSGLALDLFDKGMPQAWLITGMCAAFAYMAHEAGAHGCLGEREAGAAVRGQSVLSGGAVDVT